MNALMQHQLHDGAATAARTARSVQRVLQPGRCNSALERVQWKVLRHNYNCNQIWFFADVHQCGGPEL